MKIPPVGAELFRADGQTWRRLKVAFQFSAEIPLLQNVQTGPMAHAASYSVGTGVLSWG